MRGEVIVMTDTIESLWRGTLCPARSCADGNKEIENLLNLINRSRESLVKEMDAGEKSLFEKYADNIDEYVYLIAMQAFCDGFRLAGKLMAETLR